MGGCGCGGWVDGDGDGWNGNALDRTTRTARLPASPLGSARLVTVWASGLRVRVTRLGRSAPLPLVAVSLLRRGRVRLAALSARVVIQSNSLPAKIDPGWWVSRIPRRTFARLLALAKLWSGAQSRARAASCATSLGAQRASGSRGLTCSSSCGHSRMSRWFSLAVRFA